MRFNPFDTATEATPPAEATAPRQRTARSRKPKHSDSEQIEKIVQVVEKIAPAVIALMLWQGGSPASGGPTPEEAKAAFLQWLKENPGHKDWRKAWPLFQEQWQPAAAAEEPAAEAPPRAAAVTAPQGTLAWRDRLAWRKLHTKTKP